MSEKWLLLKYILKVAPAGFSYGLGGGVGMRVREGLRITPRFGA